MQLEINCAASMTMCYQPYFFAYLTKKLHSWSLLPWPAVGRSWCCRWCSSCPLSWWGWCGRWPGCRLWQSSRCSTVSCPIHCSRRTVSSGGGRIEGQLVEPPAHRFLSPPPAEWSVQACRGNPGWGRRDWPWRGAAQAGHCWRRLMAVKNLHDVLMWERRNGWMNVNLDTVL